MDIIFFLTFSNFYYYKEIRFLFTPQKYLFEDNLKHSDFNHMVNS